jgi:ABC-type oligopeptide transport system ATPase subunit
MIFKYINIAPEYRLLFKAYLVSCYIPGIPHPAIMLYGEKGSVKTTTAKVIKRLVDPCGTEVINSLDRSEQELSQAFQHNLWLCFDNISKITAKQSDLLCGAVTGSGYQKRELYSDDRTVVYNYRNCIAITGTSNVAERDDFLDRCILFPLERISDAERKMDSTVWDGFEEDKPYILDAIFGTLSKANGKFGIVKLDKLSRMADFNVWAVAIAEAIGDGLGEEFQRQYKSNMDRQNLEALVSNPFAATVMAFAHKLHGKTWDGSASRLLEQLRNTAYEENIDSKCQEFPKHSSNLTKKLNAIKSNLSGIGIQVSHKYDSRKVSHITLYKEPLNTTPPDRSGILRQPVTKAETVPLLNFSEGEI